MKLLVFNAGSTSIKFAVFNLTAGTASRLASGTLAPPRGAGCIHLQYGDTRFERDTRGTDIRGAVREILALLRETVLQNDAVDMIAHRLVCGDAEQSTARVDQALLARLESCATLAPLHQKVEIELIRAASAELGKGLPAFAAFDSHFFRELPEAARTYALPAELRTTFGIRRVGYHGFAHRSMLAAYEAAVKSTRRGRRIVSFQLGGGASVAAIRDGRPLDTSMGYTPLEGLVMGTRCGDLDPGAIFACLGRGMGPDALHALLETRSGLLGLSGTSADARTVLHEAARGQRDSQLAIEVYCERARKYLGAYLAVLKGADAVLFGGGIGEHQAEIRERICAGFQWCGLELDASANLCASDLPRRISTRGSRIQVFVTPVDEEAAIAQDLLQHANSRATEEETAHG
ncbi:MAG: acetate/propionate family kinase [Nevskia sp.]|nr:acetate/propionate family kinase [Nevskia sp.]